jgi:selenide, water dikinase
VSDAGGSITGGHTIRSAEPIFGLAVQGLVHPDRVWSKAGARPGDRLLLSKPLGTGIALAGSDPTGKRVAITGMRELNRAAAERLSLVPSEQVHAVTDVTGFGLAGHGWEMAERSGVEVVFDGAALPLYPSVRSLAASGVKTGGHDRNQTYLGSHLVATADPLFEAVVLDPQTSGGLLASVDPAAAEGLIDAGWWPVGEVRSGSAAVFLV